MKSNRPFITVLSTSVMWLRILLLNALPQLVHEHKHGHQLGSIQAFCAPAGLPNETRTKSLLRLGRFRPF